MNVPRASSSNMKQDLRNIKGGMNFFQTVRQGDRQWNSKKIINKSSYYKNPYDGASTSWDAQVSNSQNFRHQYDMQNAQSSSGSPQYPTENVEYLTPVKKVKSDSSEDEYFGIHKSSSSSSLNEVNNMDFFNLGQLSKSDSVSNKLESVQNIFSNSTCSKSPRVKIVQNKSFSNPTSVQSSEFQSISSLDNRFRVPEMDKKSNPDHEANHEYFNNSPRQNFDDFFLKPNFMNENAPTKNYFPEFPKTVSKDFSSNVSAQSKPSGFGSELEFKNGTSISSLFKSKDAESFFKTPTVTLDNPASYDELFNYSVSSRKLPHLATPLFQTNAESLTPKSKVSSMKSKSNTYTKTSKSNSDSAFVVIAITEGRGCATGEVGIASIDLKNPILTLCQLSDYQTYTKTLTKLNLYDPAELVVPDTFESPNYTSDFFKRLSNYFSSVRLVKVKRQYFSGQMGLEALRSLCIEECSSVELVATRKFYALAALSALVKYVEYEHNVLFCNKALKIVYECASGTVSLDLETAKRLELVMSQGDMINPEKYSLLGCLNNTVTLGGKRRLRSEVLQPFSKLSVIEERLNIVSYLINDRPFLSSIQAVLEKFNNVERLLWLCKKPPNFKQEQKTSEILTSYILILKNTLETVPLLRDLLSEGQDEFFIKIRDMLCDKRLEEMKTMIQKTIHPDARPGKGYQATEMNRCFSIKDNINGLLDVARSTYSKLINDVQEMILELATQYSLPLKMSQTADFGFHAILPINKKDDVSNMSIPDIFTDVKQKGSNLHLSTDEIFSFNARIRRTVQEIQIISNIVLNELMEDVKPMVGCLYILCEKIAELDVVCSLAKVSCSPDYTRPVFGQYLDVKAGRHPILDFHQPNKPIPNDIFASKNKNFNIITGPNMGGKTVYALQIAILQIIAQIGCYVPADSAYFRLTDHIYVRKGGIDSIEFRGSTFTIEIKELSYTIDTLTDTSLIVIDEICTGTNYESGTAISWGLCEEFLKRPVFTFLTTHFHFLTNLERIFTNATNYHLEAINPGGNTPLTFTYRLLKGVTDLTNYGIKVMMTTSLPDSMKENAIKIIEDLCRKRANALPIAKLIPPEKLQTINKIDTLENFMQDLYNLSKSDNFTLEAVQQLQIKAKNEIIPQFEGQ